jgi:tripartite-type tricarboxylate transporter receptor subunit TctC
MQVLFDPVPSSIEYVRTGKLRALGVTTAQRSEFLPDVAAIGEFVPGYEASTWFGAGAPRDTPPEIIRTLNSEINAILAYPTMRARLADVGASVFTGSPVDFKKHILDEIDKWATVVRFAGVKPD